MTSVDRVMQSQTRPPMAGTLARKYLRPDWLLIAVVSNCQRSPSRDVVLGFRSNKRCWDWTHSTRRFDAFADLCCYNLRHY